MKIIITMLFVFVLSVSLNAQWVNGQNAAFVIGQPDFTSSTAATTATGLNMPWGIAVDETNNKLYVVDWGNHRVLRYALPITQNQPAAELVLGQANFTSGSGNRGGSVTANTLNYPKGIALFNDTLWVADYSSERVLRFDNAHAITTNGANANGALGGTSALTGYGVGTGQSGLYPNGLFVDGNGNLFVTDDYNQRIVRFNNPGSKPSGANADGVLGQTDYITRTSGNTASKFYKPYDGVFIGTTLFVVDYGNHRILKFNDAATKPNGADADGVLGAPDFTTSWNGSDITWLINNVTKATAYPVGIAATPSGELLVGQNLPRISIFNNATSIANFSPADNVLGQPSLDVANKGVTQSTFPGDIRDVCYNSTLNQLYVSDFGANRVLVFNKTTTSIENISETPQQFGLLQNFPNPFNPSTNIQYSLPKDGFVTIKVFDVLGREITTLVSEAKPAGNYTITWNASNLPSGLYFLQLDAKSIMQVQKMILMK